MSNLEIRDLVRPTKFVVESSLPEEVKRLAYGCSETTRAKTRDELLARN